MASREEPISPVSKTKPDLTISAASINSEPVELESTPISPRLLQGRGSKSATDANPEDQKLREDLMRERKVDPAVLVDIPDLPNADQLAQADTAVIGHTSNEDSAKHGAR